MNVKVITPRKIVFEKEMVSVTVPSAEGEMTILPHHEKLLSLLAEGIMTLRASEGGKEEYIAIGGGYLETDGKEVSILVSHAYHQDEIDEKLINEAIAQAQKQISLATEEKSRAEAQALLRRSVINMKLIKKRRHAPSSNI